ncbi:MAG: AMIN domain-containing protein, partial [Cyanobacteria bacterium P01_F01_bin.153]
MSSFKIFYWLLATGVLTLGLSPTAQALTGNSGSGDSSGSVTGVGRSMLLSEDGEPLASLQPTAPESAIALEERVLEVTQSDSAPVTTLDEWRAQIAQAQVRITNVRVEETEAGLQVILETAGGAPKISDPRTVGNALVSEISNAVLDLPSGEDLEEFAPVDGIALVRVSSLPGNLVQVSITGNNAVPQAQIATEGGNLVLRVEPGVAVAADDDDAIQVLVTGEGDEGYAPSDSTTGTRTDTPLRDIPQSIQIISSDVIEDQQLTRLDDALRNVSGVSQNSADPRGQRF